jgi:tetratricopeptide (TPR) repeat protein
MSGFWPFGKKKEAQVVTAEALRAAEVDLRQEIEQGLVNGRSRQSLFTQIEQESLALEKQPPTPANKARLYALDTLHAELRGQLMSNLSEGKALEMAGQVDEAVAYYETAVADQIASRFPYEHLRVIYVRRKQYDDARRVCLAALDNPFLDEKAQAHFQTWAERLVA